MKTTNSTAAQNVEILISRIAKKHNISDITIIDAIREYITAPKNRGWEIFLAATEPLLSNTEWRKLLESVSAAKNYTLNTMLSESNHA